MNMGSGQSPSSALAEATINVITEALCTLNFMATVDLNVLQVGGTCTRVFRAIGIELKPSNFPVAPLSLSGYISFTV